MTTFGNKLNLIQIRIWFLTISNILGIIICIYFMLKAKNYSISVNFLTTFMPGVANKLNAFMQITGTFILIIPLTLIILTFLIPQNIPLRIMGSFFGVGSTLLIILSGVFQNTLTNVYNMKLFLVTRILSLEEKNTIFVNEYKYLVKKNYIEIQESYDFLIQLIDQAHLDLYTIKLNILTTTLDIIKYAEEVFHGGVIQLSLMQNQSSVIPEHMNHDYKKYILYATIAIVGIIAFAAIVRYLTTDDNLKELGESVYRGADMMKQHIGLTTKTAENAKEGLETVVTRIPEVAAEAADIVSQRTKHAFGTIRGLLQGHEEQLVTNTNNIATLSKLIDNNHNEIGTMKEKVDFMWKFIGKANKIT